VIQRILFELKRSLFNRYLSLCVIATCGPKLMKLRKICKITNSWRYTLIYLLQ